MIFPMGNETVTLIMRVERVENGKTRVNYAKHMLHGCSWRQRLSRYLNDTDAVRSREITCRIPAGQMKPSPGDCLFLGTLEDTPGNSREIAEALERHASSGAFRIQSVADNARRGMPMPHYAARGG